MSAFARLNRTFARLDDDTIQRGRGWYPQARRLAADMAADTGYTLDQAVAVLAITSPGAQLRTNFDWTRKALESRGEASVGRFPNAMRPKIQAVLADPEYASQYVRGPKVGPFFQAILGDEDALVLDRWALFAAGHADRNTTPAPTVRRRIEAAYHRAAERAGMSVRDFQAAVWIHVRENTARADGRIHRLADIV